MVGAGVEGGRGKLSGELRALGWWSESSPAPEALASPEPFCVDT
ncbi:YqcC family protein, partial [Pseudomonas aeruginosa]